MILKFGIENFKSFEHSSTITALAAPASTKSKLTHEIQGVSVLKNIAIFGPNASGKTGIVSGVSFLQQLLREGDGFWTTKRKQTYCRIHANNAERESRFSILFSLNEEIFSYEISLRIAAGEITGEKLYLKEKAGDNFNLIFVRNIDGEIELTSLLLQNIAKEGQNKLKVYVNDYKKNLSSPFLSFLCYKRNYDDFPLLKTIQNAYQHLIKGIVIVSPDGSTPTPYRKFQDKQISKVREIVNCFDLGINQIKLRVVSRREILEYLPEEVLDDFINIMREKRNKMDSGISIKAAGSTPEQFFFLELKESGAITYKLLKLTHQQSDSHYDYGEESDGTRRIFQLMDVLLTNDSNTVYIIDELDRSLHTSLVAAFVNKFNNSSTKNANQLIFTTHDIHLLDNRNILSPDEIFFVDRGADTSSQIYSLADFTTENIPSITKAYMQGRFGALPSMK